MTDHCHTGQTLIPARTVVKQGAESPVKAERNAPGRAQCEQMHRRGEAGGPPGVEARGRSGGCLCQVVGGLSPAGFKSWSHTENLCCPSHELLTADASSAML